MSRTRFSLRLSIWRWHLWLIPRWLELVGKLGGSASWEHGLNFRPWDKSARAGAASYAGKIGSDGIEEGEVSKVVNPGRFSPAYEISYVQNKRGALGGQSLSPWGLLRSYDAGNTRAGDQFREYAAYTKGKRQLVPSSGLYELLKFEDISDARLAEYVAGRRDLWLAHLSRDRFKRLMRLPWAVQARLLDVAESDADSITGYLDSLDLVQ